LARKNALQNTIVTEPTVYLNNLFFKDRLFNKIGLCYDTFEVDTIKLALEDCIKRFNQNT
jgi:hypothetical protein